MSSEKDPFDLFIEVEDVETEEEDEIKTIQEDNEEAL